MRTKWHLEECNKSCISANKLNFDKIDKDKILQLLDSDLLTSHFQPIFSAKDGTVFGYEALARIKENKLNVNIKELFNTAVATNMISFLDVKCRENAISIASNLGIAETGKYLFINVNPKTLIDPAHREGITEELLDRYGISRDKVVLEITEESAIEEYSLFHGAVLYYKNRGYKIAIDDFGSGYAGLKMLSIIEPDFVKIDRHFISNIDKATVKFNLVDSIISVCHRMGIKVIAEGIENKEEVKTLINIGIDLLQGYYLYKPSPILNEDKANIPLITSTKVKCCTMSDEQCLIGELAKRVEPISSSVLFIDAFYRFMKDPELRSLPVVNNDRLVGMLQRNRFLENNVLGRYGYGMHLNATKLVESVMEQPTIVVEANTAIEDVAQRIQLRKFEFVYDDIYVTKSGKYFGVVSVHSLLDAITERNLVLAKNANPLTGLPGNETIQREIIKRISQNMHFDVCYIDIDNFKPYNDHYGFEKGDMVIKILASIIKESIDPNYSDYSFVGHIGGDDFILITVPQVSIPTCEKIISEFEKVLPELHGVEDYVRGYYVSKNRKNEEEKFNLLSISIGIVSTEVRRIDSYAHLASIAAEVKKAAKMQSAFTSRSSIVRDRRLLG